MTSGSAERPIKTEWLSVPTDDTFDIGAFVARPDDDAQHPVLFVIAENPGILEPRRAETVRQAETLGAAVVVLNTYSRIGGVPPEGPFESAEERRRANFLAMPDEQVAGDLDVLMRFVLGEMPWAQASPSALLGYCSGGGQAFYAACSRDLPVSSLVVIYGNIVLRGEFTANREPLDRIPMTEGLSVPLLGHFGELDHEIGPAQVARLEEELRRLDKEFRIYNYAGAGHVFADPTHPNHHPAATALLWERTYPFLRDHLGLTV